MEQIKKCIELQEQQIENKKQKFLMLQEQEINKMIDDFLIEFNGKDMLKKFISATGDKKVRKYSNNFINNKGTSVHTFVNPNTKTVTYLFSEKKIGWQLVRSGFIFMLENEALVAKEIDEYYYYDCFDGFNFYEENIKDKINVPNQVLYDIIKWVITNTDSF